MKLAAAMFDVLGGDRILEGEGLGELAKAEDAEALLGQVAEGQRYG